MPQMAPLWWTTLYIMFNMLFLAMIAILYFQEVSTPMEKKSFPKKTTNYNWKW